MNTEIFSLPLKRLTTAKMISAKELLLSIWDFYRDGFRNMTWGRPLIWLILLKIFILFAILRLFFFKPAMRGLTDEQKSELVGAHLTEKTLSHTDTLTFN